MIPHRIPGSIPGEIPDKNMREYVEQFLSPEMIWEILAWNPVKIPKIFFGRIPRWIWKKSLKRNSIQKKYSCRKTKMKSWRNPNRNPREIYRGILDKFPEEFLLISMGNPWRNNWKHPQINSWKNPNQKLNHIQNFRTSFRRVFQQESLVDSRN